jgi:hypothetical protein
MGPQPLLLLPLLLFGDLLEVVPIARAQGKVAQQEEAAAVEAVEQVGGGVDRDEKAPGRPVVYVGFSHTVANGDLDTLRAFSRLTTLTLNHTDITDAGLKPLEGLTQLKTLSIWQAKISGPGLAHLRTATGLEQLSLAHTPITDTGLAHLAGLVGLKELRLSDTSITDAGLKHLKGLTRLEELALSDAAITDAGLAELAELTRLERLSLRGTSITDRGLAHLKGLKRLRHLELFFTAVTPAGAAKLKESLPYTLIRLDLGTRAPVHEAERPSVTLARGSALAALAIGAALCLLARPWRSLTRRRAWVWKVVLLLSPVLLLGAELLKMAPARFPVRNGDPAQFWLAAGKIDVGLQSVEGVGGIYQPRDGWFIYYELGWHGSSLYRVEPADALALFPQVVERLRNAPPGVLHPDVENGFREWHRADPGQANAPLLFAMIREAKLARLWQQDRQFYEFVRDEENAFGRRWERINRYGWNVALEFLFLAGLIVFAAWPWLRGAGPIRWGIHLGLVPILFFVPYWLGYARLTFTSAGPSGGVLYPELLSKFRGLPWTRLDTEIVRNLPQVLEPLSQTRGPMLSLTNFGGVGPVAVVLRSLVLAALVFAAGEAIRRVKQRNAMRSSGDPLRPGERPTS